MTPYEDLPPELKAMQSAMDMVLNAITKPRFVPCIDCGSPSKCERIGECQLIAAPQENSILDAINRKSAQAGDHVKSSITEPAGAAPDISSELYNAALEAIDDHEAARRVDYYSDNSNVLPARLYIALKDWTDLEYKKHWGMK